MEEDFLQLFSSFTHFRIRGQITILIKKQLLNFQCQNYDSFDSVLYKFSSFLSRQRKNKGVGAEKRGILLFRFLTSNETLKYQSKKLKIRPDIKLTQVDFF